MFASFLNLLFNYMITQIAIILFMAPFYLIYRYHHSIDNGEKLTTSQHLVNFFCSRQANYLVFFWALGEALVWFVIPEFLLLLLIFMRIRRKRELLIYDIAGTAIGTVIALIVHLPDRLIARLPYIRPGMIIQTRHWYAAHGIFGLIFQPFSGIPYKVFTNLAPDFHFFLPLFIVVAVIVRMSRYYLTYVILSSIYPVLHKYVYRNYVRLYVVATFIFTLLLLRVFKSYR